MVTETKKRDFRSALIDRLHHPFQLRIAVCAALLGLWYFLGYSPMKERISATTLMLERDRKRLALATEVELLRGEVAEFVDRLPPRSDPNEFLQYVLGGVRAGPLKLISLSPDKPKEAGPYEVATVKIDLEGKYKDIDAFLRWVENDKRLLRIDALKVEPDTRNPDLLKVQLSILGLMGVEENTKTPAKDDPTKPKPKANPPKPITPARKPTG
jgi:Tfp pilus assembly protein PilO